MGCNQSRDNNYRLDCFDEEWLKFFKKEENSHFGSYRSPSEGEGNEGMQTGRGQRPSSEHEGRQISRIDLLNDQEKELIECSWSVLSHRGRTLGKQVFLKIFELRPAAKNLFPFRNASGDALTRHPLFATHAKRFLRVIDCVAERLDRLEDCHVPLIRLGVMHLKIKGFLPDYFDVFTRAIVDVWRLELGDRYQEGTDVAWRKVLDFVVTRLKEGYESERMRAAYFSE